MTERTAGTMPARAPAPTRRSTRVADWLDVHARVIALVAVGLALAIAGGYAIVLGGQLRFLDEQVYVGLTRSLAQGHGFTLDGSQPTAYRPPGYPALLLPAYLVSGGSVLAMRFVGVLALAGSAWFGYLVGRRAHRPATGALAALVIACYPLLVYTADTLYPQVPALFLLLLTIEVGQRAVPAVGPGDSLPPVRRRVTLAAVAGLAGGLLTLTVPTFGVTAVVVVAWLVLRQRRARRGVGGRVVDGRTVVVLLVATAVLPSAWCARNAVALHAFVPVSTNNGINMLLGNSPNATAGGGTSTDISTYTDRARLGHFGETEIDRFYTAKALSWIYHNPGRAATLYAEKVANNFTYRDDLATAGANKAGQDLVSALSYYPVLALALLRVLLLRRFPLRPNEKLLLGLIVLNVLLLAVFFTRLRFRVPLDGLTIVLAASTVTHLLARGRDAVSRRST